jgi:hypothetical protein
MADRSGYIGRAPGDSAVIIARQTYAPTGIQTDFTFNATYTPGYLDVYLNGARLIYPTDYSASDGSTVGLTTYAINGDSLELVAYKSFNIGSIEEAAGNFSVGNNLTVTGDLTVSGSTTLAAGSSVSYATTSFGVSGLTTGTNITATNIVGTALTSTGVVKITDTTESTNATSGALVITGGVGIAKSLHVAGNVTIGGTLRTEDKVNVDSIGIVTAGGGLYVGRDGSGSGIGLTADVSGNVITAGFITAKNYDDAGGNISRFYGVGIHSSGDLVGWGVTQINFIGAGNTFAYNPGTNNVDVSISGSSGSSGGAVLDITACLFV